MAAGGFVMHQVFWLDFGCSQPSWWWQEAQLPPQPSPFQPPCLEIQTTASPNGQDQNGDNSANRHKKDLSLA